jgi:hypothetical protein
MGGWWAIWAELANVSVEPTPQGSDTGKFCRRMRL